LYIHKLCTKKKPSFLTIYAATEIFINVIKKCNHVLTLTLANSCCMVPIIPLYVTEVVALAGMWIQSLLGASNLRQICT
jgi:hypothetical protein